MKRLVTSIATVASILAGSAAFAQGMGTKDVPKAQQQSTDGMKAMQPGPASGAATHKATGVVKKTDPARGIVTLSHGPVPTLKWPAMTMDFEVADRKLLENVKAGAKVEFEFRQESKGKYVVTAMKP